MGKIDLKPKQKVLAKCIMLTPELDAKLRTLVEQNPGTNISLVTRKILEGYFKENPVSGDQAAQDE